MNKLNLLDEARDLELKNLRKELFKVQDHFIDLLCGDGEVEETRIQRTFGFLIWEIDEELRLIAKKNKGKIK